jgi:hypothetical protein
MRVPVLGIAIYYQQSNSIWLCLTFELSLDSIAGQNAAFMMTGLSEGLAAITEHSVNVFDARLGSEHCGALLLPLHTGSLKRCYGSMVAGVCDSDDSLRRGELKHKLDCRADRRCRKPATLGMASKREANLGMAYVLCEVEPNVSEQSRSSRLSDSDLQPLTRTKETNRVHFFQEDAGLCVRQNRPSLIAAQIGIGAVGLKLWQIRSAQAAQNHPSAN